MFFGSDPDLNLGFGSGHSRMAEWRLQQERARIDREMREQRMMTVDANGVPAEWRDPWADDNSPLNDVPRASHGLPMAHAPEAVQGARRALTEAVQRFEGAEEKARTQYEEYGAIADTAHAEMRAALKAGKPTPASAAEAQTRQAETAPGVRQAIAERDALWAHSCDLRDEYKRLLNSERYEWRNITATHVVKQIPKTRAKVDKAVESLRAALYEADELSDMADACRRTDSEWSQYNDTPAEFAEDQQSLNARARMNLPELSLSGVVDEAAKHAGSIAFLGEGTGKFRKGLTFSL
ncbi:exonuclease [Streptomyces sp. NBRC 110611]|uniref:hypothetical protein n=1 Tax=Streptomyces sp. NBRC 110611 TaxID=1621259 RepID=UPI00082B7271|nr:hypothetical protein [Streptomyces sp. NBRC 110611]GAU69920.1 exonuclease [Streptomyces sp. NBRC 110611]